VSLMDQELLTSHNDVIQHGRSFFQCQFGSMFSVSMKVITNSNLEKREISESTSHQTSVVRSKHTGV
jgi:hypothetical protein